MMFKYKIRFLLSDGQIAEVIVEAKGNLAAIRQLRHTLAKCVIVSCDRMEVNSLAK